MKIITIDRAVVEQALEVLELVTDLTNHDDEIYEAIDAFRTALAQEPAPMPSLPPVSQWKRGCVMCGIGADGKAYGYVCSRSDCPTKITCGGAV